MQGADASQWSDVLTCCPNVQRDGLTHTRPTALEKTTSTSHPSPDSDDARKSPAVSVGFDERTQVAAVVDRVLASVRLSGSAFSRADMCAPFAVVTGGAPSGIFHAVLRGEMLVRTPGFEDVVIGVGEAVFFCHGDGHELATSPGAPGMFDASDCTRQPIRSLPSTGGAFPLVRAGGNGALTSILCGTVVFDHSDVHPLLSGLSKRLVVDKNHPASASVRATILAMAAEVSAPAGGSHEVMTRLADIVVLQAVRGELNAQEASNAVGPGHWTRALRDPRIAAGLAVIHSDYASPWEVAGLAAEAGMSRSAFYARFTELVGEAPLRYLRRWRIHMAARMLRDKDAQLERVAEAVGYGSVASFAKAFKRVTGATPGSVRDRAF